MVKIGWQNVLQLATGVVASSEDTANSGNKENAFDGIPTDYWKTTAGGTQTLDFDLGAATAVDFLVLYRMDLQGGQIGLQYSADGATGWTDIVAAFTPATPVVLVSFNSTSQRYLRLNITGAAAAISLAHVCIGSRLEYKVAGSADGAPQKGFAPILFQPAKGKANVTAEGYPTGSDFVLVPAPLHIKFDFLDPAVERTDWVPFLEYAKTGAVFVLSWDDTNYPNEAAFCWLDPIQAKNAPYDYPNLMGVDLQGHALVVN